MTAATEQDVREALESYARDWNDGLLDDQQQGIQALLAARRSDMSPMVRWGTFELLAAAVRLADAMPHDEGRTKARDRFLDELAGAAAWARLAAANGGGDQ